MDPKVVMSQRSVENDFALGVLAQPKGELTLFCVTLGEPMWVELTDKNARALYDALDHYLHCQTCRAARTAEFCFEKAVKNSVDDR